MSEIRAALRAELYRLRRGTARTLLALPAVVAALRIAQECLFERFQRASEGAPETASGFASFADGLRAGGSALTFALLILGALSLVRDRESGVLAAAFTLRSRLAVVLGKAFALIVVCAVSFVAAFLVSYLLANFTRGLGPIELEGVVVVEVAELWQDIQLGALAVLPPLCCAGFYALAISALSSTSGAAVATVLVPFVCFDVLKSALPASSRYVFASYAPLLGEGSTLSRLTDLARGYSNVDWAEGELSMSCLVPLVSGGILLVLTALATRLRPA